MPDLDMRQARFMAGLELNLLLNGEALPASQFERARLGAESAPVYDLNGELLYNRVTMFKGKQRAGVADLSANPALGAVLLSVSLGEEWNPKTILAEAASQAGKLKKDLEYDTVRLVAYSQPKLAAQFLLKGQEQLMLELYSWRPVPPAPPLRRGLLEAENFERWSLLEELTAKEKNRGEEFFRQSVSVLQKALKKPSLRGMEPLRLMTQPAVQGLAQKADQRVIGYAPTAPNHTPCYEVRGQMTSLWCVAASMEMLLTFYRYQYDQPAIAKAMGMGTLKNPSGMLLSNCADVSAQLQALTKQALKVDTLQGPAPDWSFYVAEIKANRPLLSIIPGHARTVAGYYDAAMQGSQTRMLQVYDPWPPNQGSVKWENFDATTYRVAYRARLQ